MIEEVKNFFFFVLKYKYEKSDDMGLLDLFRRKENINNEINQAVPSIQPVPMQVDEYGNAVGEFLIEDVFTISGRGTVVTGRVVSGSFAVGESVKIPQIGINTTITGIEMFRKTLDHIVAGDNAGLLLSSVNKDQVQKGYTIIK